MQILFKNNIRLGKNYHVKDQIPRDLSDAVVYKIQRGPCNDSYYGECVRHLNVKIAEPIRILPLTKYNLSLRTAP